MNNQQGAVRNNNEYKRVVWSGSTMEVSRITPENQVSGKKEKPCNIAVFVRVRPMNTQELAKSAANVIDTPGTREVVVRERSMSNVSKTFTFDKVFGPKSKQCDVYKSVVAPLVQEVLLGYNCTVFAYGQTGTGKTFTMEGERISKNGSTDIDPMAGILPRALSQVFDEVRMMNCEFTVRVSFLELYNEELFDLLSPIEESKTKTLRLFEDVQKKGSVIIQGLEEVIVTNKQEVYAVLDRGSQQRKTAATLMNATSSRSHTIFTITVHLKESSVEGEEMLKIGKLHLVDLAGSENIGKSGAVAVRAREAGSINQSLLTLGRVISALVERTPHVPYRESKLTRLLRDSLGGKTKTSIIATISPAATNLEETLSTLEYAHRAKNIMNKPEVNQKLTKKEALTIYTDEIERLRRDLMATREKNGVFIDSDNYSRTMCQLQAQQTELNEKSNRIKELEDQLVEKEEAEREAAALVEELREEIELKDEQLEDARKVQEDLESKLRVEQRRSEELKYLIKYHLEREEKLSGEASVLLNTATDNVQVIESLHSRLDHKQGIEERNWANSQRFRDEFHKRMEGVMNTVTEYAAQVNGLLQQATGNVDEFWEGTYIQDNSTGATPMRKKYEFPSKLTLPSPHERVMSRYRAVKKDVQQAIDDCGKSLDDSWSEMCFKKLADPVTRMEVFGEEETDEADDNENSENQDPIRNLSLETIKESLEQKENSGPSDVEELTAVAVENQVAEEKTSKEPQAQQQTGSGKVKRSKPKRKSSGKGKGVLKASN